MVHLRSIALGSLLTISVVTLAAQDVRDTIGPLEKAARPSSPENPIPRRTASAQPTYPAELARINGGGGLRLWVTIDDSGRVAEIRKFGEPTVIPPPGTPLDDAFRRAVADAMLATAVAAVRQWTYEAPSAPIVFIVLVNFPPGREPTAVQQDLSAAQAAGGVPSASSRGAPPAPSGRGVPRPPVIPASPPWPAAESANAIRGNVPGMTHPKRTKGTLPRYTPEAMKAKVQGTVVMEVLIGTDGRVKDARVVNTVSPLLNQPALDAVRQWEFTPAMVNGEARAIVLVAEMDFNLR